MPASDVQRVWEDSVQTTTPWPGLQAGPGPWIARGLWTAIAPQSMELRLLRGQLNEYLVANTAWAVAIAEHLARLDVEVQSLRHEVHVLVSASTSGASPARPSASGVPPGLTSPSASAVSAAAAPPGTIEELIRAAQRVAVLRSGASTPVDASGLEGRLHLWGLGGREGTHRLRGRLPFAFLVSLCRLVPAGWCFRWCFGPPASG